MKLYNAKIYTMNCNDTVYENGYVEITDGKITSVGEAENITPNSDDIDLKGMCLYPGFIDAHCHVGVWEDGLGFEGSDGNEETDPCTPHLRAVDMINPLDFCFEEAAKAGVTSVASGVGSANPVGGSFLAMKTAGSKQIDKRIIKNPIGIKFALGENPKTVYEGKNQQPNTRMATAAIIREQLFKAKRYLKDTEEAANDTSDEISPPDFDMKCEALIPLLNKQIKAHFHCHRADDIFTAIRIAEEFSLDYVLIHATEGAIIADELAQKPIQAVVGPILCDRSKPELKNLTIKTSSVLNENNIKFAICTDHPVTPIQYLGVSAGLAVKGGLPYYQALKAITANAAEILGISQRIGSVEIGKDADLCCFAGNPLEVMSAPSLVMIDGKVIVKDF